MLAWVMMQDTQSILEHLQLMEAMAVVSPLVGEVVVEEVPNCKSEVAMTIALMLQLTLDSTLQPTIMTIDRLIAELVTKAMRALT